MKKTRKRYSAEFKAKVAMEAIRGELTLAELAAKHGIHHTMIGTWKRQAMDGMASLFDSDEQVLGQHHPETARLPRQLLSHLADMQLASCACAAQVGR